MKICHVTSMHDWKDDRIFERACIGLKENGHEVHFVASPKMSHYVSDLGQKNNEPYTDINGVRVHWLKQRSGIKRRIYSSMEATRIAKTLKPDIIHFHDPDLLPFMLLAQWGGHKVVYDVHENYGSRFAKKGMPKLLGKILSKAYNSFESFLIRQFSGTVLITESLARLLNAPKHKSAIVGNLPYLRLLKQITLPDTKYDKVTVVTSGIISHQRNATETLLAAEKVVAKNPNINFLFGGKYPGNFETEMRELTAKLKLENNVRIEGMVPYLENYNRVGKAHIGCVFYEDNPNHRIGLPNRAFEYMYCGLAILGDDFPEVKRLVQETNCGVVVQSTDADKLAATILELASDPERVKQFGENGRKAVLEKYNFEKALSGMIELYEKIVKK